MVLKRKQRHHFCHTNITEEALAPPEGLGLFAVTHFPELMAILMAAWEALVSRLFSAPILERVDGWKGARQHCGVHQVQHFQGMLSNMGFWAHLG